MSEGVKPAEKNILSSALASPAGRACLALVLMLMLGLIFNGDGAFFKIGTHRDALRQTSVYGILACGMTLVIISGGIDLAVGSMLALVAVCCAQRWRSTGTGRAALTVLVSLIVGIAAAACLVLSPRGCAFNRSLPRSP